jgi:hypothetical protein
LTVTYSVYLAVSKRNSTITQKYLIYLDLDPFGGAVIGRNITEQDALKKKGEVASQQHTTFEDLLNQSDKNKDDMLARYEAPRELLSQWRKIDLNRDGKIDQNEYERYQENKN